MSKSTLNTQKSATDGPSLNPKFSAGRRPQLTIEELASGIENGDVKALAMAITLVESTVAQDVAKGQELINLVRKGSATAMRIGVTGVPGVGKSTFLENYGMFLLESDPDAKVAVLAIDPSSNKTGGSILGDKTRMIALSRHERAFIRPSASGGSLGGVARATKEALLLCESAGFTHVFVETVGVGQSETTVAQLVDAFLFLAMPGTGDELQGIKKGIMEMADIIAINKSEGENAAAAKRTKQDLSRAMQLVGDHEFDWTPPISLISALEKEGFDVLSQALDRYFRHAKGQGWLLEKRQRQELYWFEQGVQNGLHALLLANPKWKSNYDALKRAVSNGEISPFVATKTLLEELKRGIS